MDRRLITAMEAVEARRLLAATNPAVIDVFFGYTAAAVNAVGGQQMFQDRLNRAVATLNFALTNSKVRATVRLVGSMQTTYVEAAPSNTETDLAALTNLADGKADDLTAAAAAAGADNIQMIVDGTGGGITQGKYNVCGVLTLAAGIVNHEFGHSLGGDHPHGPGEQNHTDPRAYEHYVTFGDQEFGGAIGGAGNWFSNPDVIWRGKPTGVAGTGPDAANNAAVMNERAPAFANNSATMVVDSTGPVVGLGSLKSINGQNSLTFTVRYLDGSGVNVDTLGNGNIVVTGPNNFSAPATLVSVSDPAVNFSYAVATYSVATPGPVGDLGQYTFNMQANSVKDTAGNSVAAGAIGTNYVMLPEHAGSDYATAGEEGDLSNRIWLNTDEIGPKWTINGFIDWNYHRFSLSEASRLSVTLPNQSTAGGLLRYSIYRDVNGNQSRDEGEEIAPDAPNTWTNLAPNENYYLFINPWQNGDVPYGAYTVRATVSPVNAPIPPAPPSTLSGAIFTDANDNSIRDVGEAGVPNIAVVLTGTSIAGTAVNMTATSDANGVFTFTGLQPSGAAGYTIKESLPGSIPALNATPGSLGGTTGADFTRTSISQISVTPGSTGTGYLFGTAAAITTASLSGSVYFDANDNGARDTGEAGIPNVTLTLGWGNVLGQGSLSPKRVVVTDANGDFIFTDVPASDTNGYILSETQPANVLDGKDTAGSIGGIANAPKNDIRGIVFNGVNGTGYLFGEKPLGGNPPAPPTPPPTQTNNTQQNTPTAGNPVTGTTAATVQLNSGGTAFGTFGAGDAGQGTNFNVTRPVSTEGVPNAAPPSVYQTLKFGTDMSFTLNGTVGTTYTVRLHFAETGGRGAGQRPFNVDINGNRAVSNLDVFTAAGGFDRALVRDFTATPDANGVITVRFIGIGGSVDENAIINAMELIPTTAPAVAPSYQLNAGGNVTGTFLGDQRYSLNTAVLTVGTAIDTAGVANAAPAAIYQSQRWANSFFYQLPTTPGKTYTVRLHFAEIFRTEPGRVFNVSLDFQEVLSNFDVFVAAGNAANKAVVRDFNYVADGSGYIQIDFDGVNGAIDSNAIINGFELIPNEQAVQGNAPVVTQLLTGPQYAASFEFNADGSYFYDPMHDFEGTDSFTYQVVDENGRVASSTVNINVTPVNQPPEDSEEYAPEFFTPQTDELYVDLNWLVYSPDNLPLTFTLGSVTGGTAMLLADGYTVRFTPDREFDGLAVVNFSVSDPNVTLHTCFVVDVGFVPQDPVAGSDTFEIYQSETVGFDVLVNDENPQGSELYLYDITQPEHGTAYIDDMGTPETSDDLIIYRPEFGFLGIDSFDYIVEDFYGSWAVGTINLDVVEGPIPTPLNLTKSFEFETRQAIVLNFNGDVRDFLERSDYHIRNVNTDEELDEWIGTLSFNGNGTQATLEMTNEIPNGNYQLTLGSSGVTLDFFVLAADANRDRVVNFHDLLVIAQNYGESPRTFSTGDFNFDGVVNFHDLLLMAQNYNESLPIVPALTANPPFGETSIRRSADLDDHRDLLERPAKSVLG